MGIEILYGAIFLASAAVSYSGYKKAKKMSQGLVKQAQGALAQIRSTSLPRRICFGEHGLGGIDAFLAFTGDQNEYAHFIEIWCDGPIKEVQALILDGEEIPMTLSGDYYVPLTGKYIGHVRMKHALGLNPQVAIGLECPGWNAGDTLTGIAHSWIEFKYNADVFTNGQPAIGARILGQNDVFDPRDDSVGYSINPVLCWLRYMTMVKRGPGLDYATKFGEPEVISAANDCDELVDLVNNNVSTNTVTGDPPATSALAYGHGEKRYTVNCMITLDTNPEDIIEVFRTSMAGALVYINGRWKPYAGVWMPPTFVITEEMLIGPIKKKRKTSRKDRVNTVKGIYLNRFTNWEPTDFKAYTKQEYVTEDGGEVLPEDIDLRCSRSEATCRRIAKINLLRGRFEMTLDLKLNVLGYRAQSAKTVFVNLPEHGVNMVPMDVLGVNLAIVGGKIEIDLNLRQTDPSIYLYDLETEEEDDLSLDTNDTNYEQPNPPCQKPGNACGGGNNNDAYYPDLFDINQIIPATQYFYCKGNGGTATLAGFAEYTNATVPPRFYKEKLQSGNTVLCNYESPPGPGCAEDDCRDDTNRTIWVKGSYACLPDSGGNTSITISFTVKAVYDAGGGNVSIDWEVIISRSGGAGFNAQVFFASGVSPIVNVYDTVGTFTGTITKPNGTISGMSMFVDTNSSLCGGAVPNPVEGSSEYNTHPSQYGSTRGNNTDPDYPIQWCLPASNSERVIHKGSAKVNPLVHPTNIATDTRVKEVITEDSGCSPGSSGGVETAETDPFLSILTGWVDAVVSTKTKRTQAATGDCVGDARLTSATTKEELIDEDTDEDAIDRLLASLPTLEEEVYPEDAMLQPPLFTESGCPSEWTGRGYGAYTGRTLGYQRKRVLLKVTGLNASGEYKIRIFFHGRYLPTNTLYPNKQVMTFTTFADGLGNTEFEFDMPMKEGWRWWMSAAKYYRISE